MKLYKKKDLSATIAIELVTIQMYKSLSNELSNQQFFRLNREIINGKNEVEFYLGQFDNNAQLLIVLSLVYQGEENFRLVHPNHYTLITFL